MDGNINNPVSTYEQSLLSLIHREVAPAYIRALTERMSGNEKCSRDAAGVNATDCDAILDTFLIRSCVCDLATDINATKTLLRFPDTKF